jgi:hypothetical protein
MMRDMRSSPGSRVTHIKTLHDGKGSNLNANPGQRLIAENGVEFAMGNAFFAAR